MTRGLYKGCLSLSVAHSLPASLPYIYLDVGCIYLTYESQNWNSIGILAVASSLQKGKTNLKILLKIIQEFVEDCFLFSWVFFFFALIGKIEHVDCQVNTGTILGMGTTQYLCPIF